MKKRSELKERFAKHLAEGKTVSWNEYIDSDCTLPIKVVPRRGDTAEKTIELMGMKLDQLVTIPEEYPINNPKKEQLIFFVKLRLEMQKKRIALGNQLAAMMRYKLKVPSDATEAEINKILGDVTGQLKKSYRDVLNTIIDGKKITKHKKDDQPIMLDKYFERQDVTGKLISEQAEFDMVGAYVDILGIELRAEGKLKGALKHFPIWNGCLSQIPGIGPVIGATLIAKINIHRTKSPGSLHRLFGVTVEDDGYATSARREHNVPTEFIDKDALKSHKWGTGYSKPLQSFILSQIMDSFIRINKPNPWKDEMKRKKKQYTLMEKHAVVDSKAKDGIKRDKDGNHVPNKGHIHKMTKRWGSKIFLNDLWLFWAAFEGIEIKLPWYDAKIDKIRHASKNNWDLMIQRMGNPLTLRKRIYNEDDGIPKCYLEGSEPVKPDNCDSRKHHINTADDINDNNNNGNCETSNISRPLNLRKKSHANMRFPME